MDLQFLAKSLW